MLRFIITPVVALGLCACGAYMGSEEGAAAAERYDLLEQSGGSAAELCDEAQKVMDVYLDEANVEEVSHWRARRDGNCDAQRTIEKVQRSFGDFEQSLDNFVR